MLIKRPSFLMILNPKNYNVFHSDYLACSPCQIYSLLQPERKSTPVYFTRLFGLQSLPDLFLTSATKKIKRLSISSSHMFLISLNIKEPAFEFLFLLSCCHSTKRFKAHLHLDSVFLDSRSFCCKGLRNRSPLSGS